MLEQAQDLGGGVSKVRFPDMWNEIAPRVSAVFSAFYEEPTPAGFYPHFNEVALRLTMLGAVPELVAFQRAVAELQKAGSRAFVIDDLHLRDRSPAERNKLLHALCLALGFLTPSTQRQATLLWDVKERPVREDRPATYSEHSAEADLHTDSQSYPVPEELFALYVIHAARCGGGASQFASVDDIKQALAQTAAGKDALEVLAQPFPFFIQAGEATGKSQVTTAPILAAKPAIRFRRDVIEQGLAARPELATPEVRRAFATLVEVLTRQVRVVEYAVPDGGIVFCDNHAMLHGRTRYDDKARHLLRMRMSAQPIAVNMVMILKQNPAFAQALLA
jgi:alpha-ketoglutarate-dependent taurine dioxygenase